MYLHNYNLTIRSAVKEDAKILTMWWNDGKVMAHAGFPLGLGTTVEKVENIISSNNDDRRVLIIEIDNIPAGEMSCRRKEGNTAEIGIKICNFDYQNKGYGTKLLKMFISYLFNDCGFEKIILDTNLNNTRAQHVYEKIGFRKVMVRADAWKDQLGNFQSSVDYEMRKEDFIEQTYMN